MMSWLHYTYVATYVYTGCIYCTGIDAIIAIINRTPLEGTFFLATVPPVVISPNSAALSSCITIKGLLAKNCSVEVLQKYFSNKKKSGINTYEAIKIINKTTAILQLADEKGEDDLDMY